MDQSIWITILLTHEYLWVAKKRFIADLWYLLPFHLLFPFIYISNTIYNLEHPNKRIYYNYFFFYFFYILVNYYLLHYVCMYVCMSYAGNKYLFVIFKQNIFYNRTSALCASFLFNNSFIFFFNIFQHFLNEFTYKCVILHSFPYSLSIVFSLSLSLSLPFSLSLCLPYFRIFNEKSIRSTH